MKSSCKVKNPESENPFPRILCKESRRIQNPRILFQEYFAKNPEESRILSAKNPESQNPFPRILCKESRRVQNHFCKESRIQNLLWRIHPACCWVTADGRRNDEQEEGTRTKWRARWVSGDSRPRDSRRWADLGALELFRISSTLPPVMICRKEADMISKGVGQSSCREDSSYKSWRCCHRGILVVSIRLG